MCIINHIKISYQNLVIYHTKNDSKAQYAQGLFYIKLGTFLSFSFTNFAYYALAPLPRARPRSRFYLPCQERQKPAPLKMKVIVITKCSSSFIIYHIKQFIIPHETIIKFKMTLETIIIILSKRKSYLVVILMVSIMGQAQRILRCA